MTLTELYLQKADNIAPQLAYKLDITFEIQKKAVREKLLDLLCMPVKQTTPSPIIDWTSNEDPRFDEIRFHFESEPGFFVPAHILRPKGSSGGEWAVICLQGHSKGMHVSIGRADIDSMEPAVIEGDRDFALQIVAEGYTAVVMEQRGFGLQRCSITPNSCGFLVSQAYALGRTLIGDRIFDICRLIDAISEFSFIDIEKIACMGNSSGGTTSFYAACVEDRIAAVMPSCCFAPFRNSFIGYYHCSCGIIPRMLDWFDMPDLVLAIAPKPLVIVSGEHDAIADIGAVRKAYEEKVEPIYRSAGVPEKCTLIVGEEGHRFYAEQSWKAFREIIK